MTEENNTYEDYPEPRGYSNSVGFVKNNPLNNASYLHQACEFYPQWAEILRETDRQLQELIPGYNIAQIKEKFWTLRFYIDIPFGTDKETIAKAFKITHEAEAKASPIG